jgi:hypothetical protein
MFLKIYINYNFALDVMYITFHLHMGKKKFNFKIMFNKFFNV